ncbi:hypothetical protein [Alcanivorax quisquiliarum]|uniref:Zinc-ribbon domain-containing protein n=1 Tax=Alcanivorax quisquiliarum TaxID=2933565 RepID=A0ABT0E853_9GAMM|nr:hypothetical protein [Alcanivorax quisquiliarum]MCK0538021.1 hypothetical protein [Alcanivorax quisquiliarum]
MSKETKSCHFCGEEILAVAQKCKHCGSSLDSPVTITKGLGGSILFTPIIIGLISLVIVSGLPDIEAGLILANTMIFLCLGLTALFIALEARKARALQPSAKGTHPFVWFLATCLIWGIAYPLYAWKRHQYGYRKRLWAGLCVTLFFVFSMGSTIVMLEERKDEPRQQFRTLIDEMERQGW